MIIRNHTDFPTSRLREMIRFCKPPGVTDFVIEFRRQCQGYTCGGLARSDQYAFHTLMKKGRVPARLGNNRPPDVLVWIQGKSILESIADAFKVRLDIDVLVRTQEESLVEVIAHELRHLWQDIGRAQGGRRAALRSGGCVSNYERDAVEWANAKVQAWRRR